jgi:hypothetical protein
VILKYDYEYGARLSLVDTLLGACAPEEDAEGKYGDLIMYLGKEGSVILKGQAKVILP